MARGWRLLKRKSEPEDCRVAVEELKIRDEFRGLDTKFR